MDVFDAIAARESCRAFAPAPVEREKLTRILDAARLAPSACNGQPWRYVAVLDPEVLRQMAPLTHGPGINRFADGAPCLIAVWEGETVRSARLGSQVKDQDYASVDIGLSVGHLCLAAAALGLSTCIMGWFHEEKLKALLGIPAAGRLRLVVALGYAEQKPLRGKVRKPAEEVIRVLG